jgi:hypothetical protein
MTNINLYKIIAALRIPRLKDPKKFDPIEISSSYASWQEVPKPDNLDIAIDESKKRRLALLIQGFVENIKTKSKTIQGIEIQIPPGFQKDLEDALGKQVQEEKLTRKIEKKTAYLQGEFLRNEKNDPGWLERNRGEICLLVPIALLAATQLVTTFINDKGSPEETWPVAADAIHKTMIFYFFTKFFTKALQLSGLIGKKIGLDSHHPKIPITDGNPITSITCPITKEQLEGSYSSDQKKSAKYANHPPVITQADEGLFVINDAMFEEKAALEYVMNLIASTKTDVSIGGSTEHTTPVSTRIILTTAPKRTEAPKAESIRHSSSRISAQIEIHPIHEKTQNSLDSLVRLIKESIMQTATTRSPNPIKQWTRQTIHTLIELLTLGNLLVSPTREDINPNEYIAWTPELNRIITTIAKKYARTETSLTPILLYKEFEARFKDLAQKEIDHSWAIYLESNDAKIPKYKLTPSAPKKAAAVTLSLEETDFLGFTEDAESEEPSFSKLKKIEAHFFSQANTFRAIAKGLATSSFLRDQELTSIYDSIPQLKDPALKDLLEKNPFALIAGRDRLVEDIVEVLDSHISQLPERSLDQSAPYRIPRPPIIVLTDHNEGNDPQYSSGKSTVIKAASTYLQTAYKAIPRPGQVLVREGDAIKHLFTGVPEGNPEEGLLEKVWQYIKDNKILTTLESAEEGVSTAYILLLTKKIYDDLSAREGYSAAIFPWLLYAVNIALTGIILYGSKHLQDLLKDQRPCQLHEGGDAIQTISITATDLTKERLLGTPMTNPKSPQTQFQKNKVIPVVVSGQANIIEIENGHDLTDPIRKSIFEMTRRREAHLGGKTKIPFAPVALFMTANDLTGKIQEEAAQYADIREELSVRLPWPTQANEQILLIQKLLIHLKEFMSVKWRNSAIKCLIDALKIDSETPGQKDLFFGLRHIKAIIKNAEERAAIEQKPLRDSHIEDAFKHTLIEKPLLGQYFPQFKYSDA